MARPKGISAWNKGEYAQVVCAHCGKVFAVKPYRKDTAKYCSRACNGQSLIGAFVGEKNTRYNKVEHTCKRCGKLFMVKAAHDKVGKFQYCSATCRYPKRVQIQCKWCQAPIMVTPGIKERGRKQFCSQGCHGAYTVATMQTKATAIENMVEQALIALNEPYITQKPMAKWLVDFYLPQYRLVIECDGDYWHSLPNVQEKDKRKNHWLKAHHIPLLRISESDIKADVMKALTEGMQRVLSLNGSNDEG